MDEQLADYANAQAALDILGIPRETDDGRALTLTERIGHTRHRFISLKLQMAAMGDTLRGIDKAAAAVHFPAPVSDLYALVKNIRQQIAQAREYVRERAAKDKTGSFRQREVEDFVPPSQRAAPAKGRKRVAMIPPALIQQTGPVLTQRQLFEQNAERDEHGRIIPWQLEFYRKHPPYGAAPIVEGPPAEAVEEEDD